MREHPTRPVSSVELVEARTRVADAATGERIALALVERRLAACAHVSARGTSFYWWEGEVQTDVEVDVVACTTTALLAALVEAILALHPYELPGVHWHPIEATEAYASWVASSISLPGGS